MSSTMLEHLKNLARINFGSRKPENSFTDLRVIHFNQETELGLMLETYREILVSNNDFSGEASTILESLFDYQQQGFSLKEDDDDTSMVDTSGTGGERFELPNSSDPKGGADAQDDDSQDSTEDLDDGQSTFADEYPNADEDSVLETIYTSWLAGIKGKPFYKTIKNYSDDDSKGLLNPSDRTFLWRLIKSVSSSITHIIIEVETQPESICLMDKYYDGLVKCMDSIVHAADTEDVMTSFRYMVDFLGISNTHGGSSTRGATDSEDF